MFICMLISNVMTAAFTSKTPWTGDAPHTHNPDRCKLDPSQRHNNSLFSYYTLVTTLQFISTLPAAVITDRVGRRTILTRGALVMAMATTVIAITSVVIWPDIKCDRPSGLNEEGCTIGSVTTIGNVYNAYLLLFAGSIFLCARAPPI